jgi:hypothetical protein
MFPLRENQTQTSNKSRYAYRNNKTAKHKTQKTLNERDTDKRAKHFEKEYIQRRTYVIMLK